MLIRRVQSNVEYTEIIPKDGDSSRCYTKLEVLLSIVAFSLLFHVERSCFREKSLISSDLYCPLSKSYRLWDERTFKK